MERIDKLGLFWLPGYEDDALSGRLQFDPEGAGITLSLVGIFDHAQEDDGSPELRILGWLGTDPVTLDRVFSTGTNHRSPGVAESSYYANCMFVGHHIEELEPYFQTARVTLSDLAGWVGESGITEEGSPSQRAGSEPYRLTFEPLPGEEAPFSGGRIILG